MFQHWCNSLLHVHSHQRAPASVPHRGQVLHSIRFRIDTSIMLSYMIAGVWSFMTAKWSLGLVIYGHR